MSGGKNRDASIARQEDPRSGQRGRHPEGVHRQDRSGRHYAARLRPGPADRHGQRLRHLGRRRPTRRLVRHRPHRRADWVPGLPARGQDRADHSGRRRRRRDRRHAQRGRRAAPALEPSRCPTGGKTGTATAGPNDDQHVSSSWFIGYTPKPATAVMFNRGVGNEDLEGYLNPFYGGTYPAMTFRSFMAATIDRRTAGRSRSRATSSTPRARTPEDEDDEDDEDRSEDDGRDPSCRESTSPPPETEDDDDDDTKRRRGTRTCRLVSPESLCRTLWSCSGRRLKRCRPASGGVTEFGTNTRLDCMCGGSANQRCLPATTNGLRAKPAASRPPRASRLARSVGDVTAAAPPAPGRGLSRRTAPKGDRRPAWPAGGSRSARRASLGARRARWPGPTARRGCPARARCRCAPGRRARADARAALPARAGVRCET